VVDDRPSGDTHDGERRSSLDSVGFRERSNLLGIVDGDLQLAPGDLGYENKRKERSELGKLV